MATTCKTCGRKLRDRTDLYCPTHARMLLREMEASGYLEPLTIMTCSGKQVLSRRRFLTVQDGPAPKTPSN